MSAPQRGWQAWILPERPGLRQFALGAFALILPVPALIFGEDSVIPAMVAAVTLGVGLGLGWAIVYGRAWFERSPVSAIGSGEAVTTTRLLGVDLAVGLAPGWVVATVAIADATAVQVLRPGDHVDLIRPAVPQAVEAAAARAVVLARNIRVLAVLSRDGPEEGVSVAVAVDETTALRLSEMSGTPLLATLRAR